MSKLISTEPATGKKIWSGSTGDAGAQVAVARKALAGWANHSAAYRMEALRRFANVVRKKDEEFATLIARETGKPFWECKTEVSAVVGKVEISINAYAERTPKRTLEAAIGNKVVVRHKPHGVLAVLGPYNFPAHLPNGHIVPALIAGNALVFKPSEKAPATGEFLVQCFREAGIPEGVIRLLIGGPDEGKALASQPDIDGLLFTGSVRAGQALHRQFAQTPGKILALELGGNNPLVVWHPKDVEAAATIAVQSAYLSAGQRCTAARRLIVEDGKHGPLIDAIAGMIDRIIVGEPFADPQPFMGPVIDNAAADHLQQQWVELMKKGATPIRPLDRPNEARPFLTPALIDVTDAKDIPDEEVFGPVLQVIRVKDFDCAIAEASATRFGLAASLVGGSPEQFEHFWSQVRAGVINWNRPTNGAPSTAPFGGVGLSGNHRPSAFYAADYCAYPVTSVQANQARGAIAQGLADPDMVED
ncbi:MAG TPA: succinylglutamate-semialdehyde dehydrogenase [Sphingomicrobium sp.]|nr:succinylglutamate-semialdehyde dehydrogenase [Sphingomicrobium sp.]